MTQYYFPLTKKQEGKKLVKNWKELKTLLYSWSVRQGMFFFSKHKFINHWPLLFRLDWTFSAIFVIFSVFFRFVFPSRAFVVSNTLVAPSGRSWKHLWVIINSVRCLRCARESVFCFLKRLIQHLKCLFLRIYWGRALSEDFGTGEKEEAIEV